MGEVLLGRHEQTQAGEGALELAGEQWTQLGRTGDAEAVRKRLASPG